jgi:hypothetical protein
MRFLIGKSGEIAGSNSGAPRTRFLKCRVLSLVVLISMACLGFAGNAVAVEVGLLWEPGAEVPGEEALGFMLYHGKGAACLDDATPLVTWVGNTVREVLTFQHSIPGVSAGLACYEVTAFNPAGESPHSERATAELSTLFPAQPTGLIVEPFIE